MSTSIGMPSNQTEAIKPAVAKKSPMNMLGMGVSRCWKGYKPNPDGRPASEKGSCVKK